MLNPASPPADPDIVYRSTPTQSLSSSVQQNWRDFTRLEFSVISNLEGMRALEEDWNKLFESDSLPHHHFLSFNWNWHWMIHYGTTQPDSEIKLVVGKTGGAKKGLVVLIWPLLLTRRLGFTQLQWMGDPVSQYGDVLVKQTRFTELWLKQAYDFICKKLGADGLFLRKVRADSNIAAFLQTQGAAITLTEQAPYLDLTRFSSYEDYNKQVTKKLRKNRRRHRRRMEEIGEISYQFLNASPEAGRVATEAIEMKRYWLKQRGLVSRAYADERLEAFFAAAFASRNRPVSSRVTRWCVSGQPAAIELGLEHKGHYIAHIGVYHPKYERHSPGTLQMEDTLRDCIARGVKVFDLLAPADRYKMQWCNQTMPVYDFAVPTSVLGQLHMMLYIKMLRQGGKRLMAAIPEKLRRHIAPLVSRISQRLG